MYKKKRLKKNIIIGSVTLFIMILGLAFLLRKEKLNPIEAFIKDSGLAVQKMMIKPISVLKKSMTDKELEELKEKALKAESLESKNKELNYQLSSLKKTLELNTSLVDVTYLNATIINRNMDYWQNLVTIDKGKKHGVMDNLPVVTSEGLIGFTDSTSNYNSSIKLLTNEIIPRKVSVKIEVKDKYVYGILTHYNYDKKTFEIEGIAENTEIPIDALVTTTGLGENIPAGIVVGNVKEIIKDNFELARVVEVKSKVNFDSINYVTVLKRKDLEQ